MTWIAYVWLAGWIVSLIGWRHANAQTREAIRLADAALDLAEKRRPS